MIHQMQHHIAFEYLLKSGYVCKNDCMKKLCLVCMVLLLTVATMAQAKQEKEVTAAVDKLRKAMVDGDRAALTDMAAEKLSYGHSSGLVEDKAAFVEKIASGKSDFVSIDLTEQTVAVSGRVAIVRHLLNAVTNDNNTPGNVKLRVLLIFQKEKGEWRLLARQAVKVA